MGSRIPGPGAIPQGTIPKTRHPGEQDGEVGELICLGQDIQVELSRGKGLAPDPPQSDVT